MKRRLLLGLKNVNAVPSGLRAVAAVNAPAPETEVHLGRLFHHLYFDTWGQFSPSPNPLHALYAPLIAPTPDYRYRGAGLGSNKQAKIEETGRFGKAFCRHTLYEHFGIRYFAHVDDILGGALHPGLGPFRLIRVQGGDAPDYLCAQSRTRIYLGEAKGRTSSIRFNTTAFASWRQQFNRVAVVDGQNHQHAVKGYIVAARQTCQQDSANVKSKLLVEDPSSPGDAQFQDNWPPELWRAVTAGHYSTVLHKLGQSLLAETLRAGSVLPPEVGRRVPIWECLIPPLQGARFVGGFYAPEGNCVSDYLVRWATGDLVHFLPRGVNLSAQKLTFVGLDLGVFKILRSATLRGPEALDVLLPYDLPGTVPDVLSVLTDGTLITSVEFMRLVDVTDF